MEAYVVVMESAIPPKASAFAIRNIMVPIAPWRFAPALQNVLRKACVIKHKAFASAPTDGLAKPVPNKLAFPIVERTESVWREVASVSKDGKAKIARIHNARMTVAATVSVRSPPLSRRRNANATMVFKEQTVRERLSWRGRVRAIAAAMGSASMENARVTWATTESRATKRFAPMKCLRGQIAIFHDAPTIATAMGSACGETARAEKDIRGKIAGCLHFAMIHATKFAKLTRELKSVYFVLGNANPCGSIPLWDITIRSTT